MNVNQLVRSYNLQPADVVVVNKSIGGILDHYMVYMGDDYHGNPQFMANMEDRVQWVSQQRLRELAPHFSLNRVRRFEGNHQERKQALARAESLDGQPYSRWKFNCEHFANYVQNGEVYSKQVDNAKTLGGVVAVAAIAYGLYAWWNSSNEDERYA